jgi:hypothetical protein
MKVRSSRLSTGRLHPQEFSWYSFLEAESTPGHMVSSVASEKIPSDTTGDRTRDLPTSSAVHIRIYSFYKSYWTRCPTPTWLFEITCLSLSPSTCTISKQSELVTVIWYHLFSFSLFLSRLFVNISILLWCRNFSLFTVRGTSFNSKSTQYQYFAWFLH